MAGLAACRNSLVVGRNRRQCSPCNVKRGRKLTAGFQVRNMNWTISRSLSVGLASVSLTALPLCHSLSSLSLPSLNCLFHLSNSRLSLPPNLSTHPPPTPTHTHSDFIAFLSRKAAAPCRSCTKHPAIRVACCVGTWHQNWWPTMRSSLRTFVSQTTVSCQIPRRQRVVGIFSLDRSSSSLGAGRRPHPRWRTKTIFTEVWGAVLRLVGRVPGAPRERRR